MATKATRTETTPTEVLRAINNGVLAPLYWIYGTETYLIDKIIEALRAVVLKGSPRGFNFDLFIGKQATASQIAQAALTIPMMGPRRLVLVRDADEFKAAEMEPLLKYLKAPSPDAVVVFISEKVDKRLKFFTAFAQAGTMIECKPLYENQVISWVADEATRRGLRLASDVAPLLANVIGTNLSVLEGSLEKIALFLAPRRDVSYEDAFAAIADTRTRSAFELVDSLGRKDLGAALSMLGKLTENSKKADVLLPALGAIASRWRQFIKATILKSAGMARGDVIREAGVFYRGADEFWASLNRFTAQELREKHGYITAADGALKSSPLEGSVIMESLIMRICS